MNTFLHTSIVVSCLLITTSCVQAYPHPIVPLIFKPDVAHYTLKVQGSQGWHLQSVHPYTLQKNAQKTFKHLKYPLTCDLISRYPENEILQLAIYNTTKLGSLPVAHLQIVYHAATGLYIRLQEFLPLKRRDFYFTTHDPIIVALQADIITCYTQHPTDLQTTNLQQISAAEELMPHLLPVPQETACVPLTFSSLELLLAQIEIEELQP